MKFTDKVVDELEIERREAFFRLITSFLCGEDISIELGQREQELFTTMHSKALREGLNWAQFNELLLVLGQDRIGVDFFKFFFGAEKAPIKSIVNGIIRFRGLALLKYGNFRYAYKRLNSLTFEEIISSLMPYSLNKETLKNEFTRRPQKAIDVYRIKKEKTWFIGYLSSQKLEIEADLLNNIIENEQLDVYKLNETEAISLSKNYRDMYKEIEKTRNIASRNNDIYLTWDYMDVYVATSMRSSWEYEETYELISGVFEREKRLQKMRLRYFDPTQAYCEGRLEKGLTEGLMLKRAACTIYMAQEDDTMGKDSELAATLAQLKPVIAYVRKIDPINEKRRLEDYPLVYFEKRLLFIKAKGIFGEEECAEKLRKIDKDYLGTISTYLTEYDEYRKHQPFSLWKMKENNFKKQKIELFRNICALLATAEGYNMDKRADLFKEQHPLSMQVHLESGVANGVLVVRSHEDCAELLRRILTNDMRYRIEHSSEGRGATILVEEISQCPFRVVTDDQLLTNSFWNHYLSSS